MGVVYGYGCITTSKTKNQTESDIKNTKAYKELKDKFEFLSFTSGSIYIDVLNGNNLKRPKLKNLLETIRPNDLLMILDLNAVGKKADEIVSFYRHIIDNGINLLIPDFKNTENGVSRFSVCDLNGNKIRSGQELYVLLDELSNVKEIKDNRGKYAKPVTEEFIDAYWQYENYFVKEETAFALAGDISKTVFYKWAKEYESGHTVFDYNMALEEQDAVNRIGIKPKRHGKRPDWFDDLVELVEHQNMLVADACKNLKVPIMHEIDYRRYRLKTSRKVMAQALFDYCKEEMLVRG